ncbi:unnamed protein product [Eruca vesicaria subsp. sativa]|uniref:PB1 domain-containing protein n=1 Tax=Eruca vesicaria subsp. sativa TaxID=29727 RepID=A0ABC8KQD2_ERUVS|nr:unnamed protein product [Eruca vesicaria subsp. sativa]
MGKPAAKITNHRSNSRAFDEDMEIFITRALELKQEGNKLFQERDNEGAMLTYEKALKLLPKDHIDVAYLRTSMASCYMRMGLGEYPNAINECNLALEASPRYSKALVRRSRCYEALNKLDLAFRDVIIVLNMETDNVSAKEVFERVKKKLVEKGIDVDEMEKSCVNVNVKKSKKKKKKSGVESPKKSEIDAKMGDNKEEKKTKFKKQKKKSNYKAEEDEKVVVMDKKVITIVEASDETVTRTVKLVHGDDIRWAQLPLDSSVRYVRDIIKDHFPSLRGFLIKYKDQEGDLITITTTDELRLAAFSNDKLGCLRLYIAEVSPDQEPNYDGIEEYVESDKASMYFENWNFQFAQMFKNHVGFDSDSYLELHDLGMKMYTEAMEEAVTGEDAQELFGVAADKFQEMCALAMFNLGNIHMSKSRKRVCFSEDASREDVIESAFVWTLNEYNKAAEKYEEAIEIKPDFYQALIALGQQQFEHAKLLWSKESEASHEVLMLYNKAEDSMERGMQIWEEMEETANMSSQINLLWGSLLYERSIVEYKLGLLTWKECLEVAVEKFELAGASSTDVAVMVKNHCSSESALEGMGFKIDEIVQAWNEMYDAKRWQTGVPSFRLEPMLRRRALKLHDVLENVFSGSA